MNKRISTDLVLNKRLLSLEEGCEYMGIGRNRFRSFADEVGATRKIGSRVLFDKTVLDRALDNLSA